MSVRIKLVADFQEPEPHRLLAELVLGKSRAENFSVICEACDKDELENYLLVIDNEGFEESICLGCMEDALKVGAMKLEVRP